MLNSCDGNCRFKEGKNGMYCTRCGEYKHDKKNSNSLYFLLVIPILPMLFLLINTLNHGIEELQYTNTSYTRENTERF